MKLRNKKTGIIGKLHFEPDKEYHFTVATEDPADVRIYKKLADLYADWEDYEEPEEYWYIDDAGVIQIDKVLSSEINMRKSIGNYFYTKEEAQKAVEKLKAWKRLKDKGFRFIDHIDRNSGQGMTRYEWDGYINGEDLDLLFGGEE